MGFDTAHCARFLYKELAGKYRLGIKSIDIIEYDPDCPFEYNNFIFVIELEGENVQFPQLVRELHLPGVDPLPSEIPRVVARVSNPSAGLCEETRIENEVACMMIARTALADRALPRLIPDVYFWSSAKSEPYRWVLMEHRVGVVASDVLESLSPIQLDTLLAQHAQILTALQNAKFPETVEGFGGLKFDPKGMITNGSMTTEPVAAQRSYVDLLVARFKYRVKKSTESGILSGEGCESMLRRIRAVENNVQYVLSTDDDHRKQVLVHNDCSFSNALVDPIDFNMTALLDFDFTYVGGVFDEFATSSFLLPLQHAAITGPLSSKLFPFSGIIRKATLTQSWDLSSTLSDVVNWNTARNLQSWYSALDRVGGTVPSRINAAEQLSAIFELMNLLTPRVICNEVVRRNRTAEQHLEDIDVARTKINMSLDEMGF